MSKVGWDRSKDEVGSAFMNDFGLSVFTWIHYSLFFNFEHSTFNRDVFVVFLK